MSYRIEYELKAIRIPANHAGDYDDVFLCIALGGDNNCYEVDSDKRVRSWTLEAIGQQWRAMDPLCEFAGSCEGGSLKLHGRWTKPENYIKAWRKAFEQAIPLDRVFEYQIRVSPHIDFTTEEATNGRAKDFEALRAVYAPTDYKSYYAKESVHRFKFDIHKPNDCAIWLKHAHGGRAWKFADVYGPGEV